MRTNSFKCKNRGEFTKHIEISSRELLAIDGNYAKTTADKIANKFGLVVAGVGDFVGFGQLTRSVTGIIPYKCCKCGRCTRRNSKGEDKGEIGFSN